MLYFLRIVTYYMDLQPIESAPSPLLEEDEALLRELKQREQQAQEQSTAFVNAFSDAWWEALRQFFGEHRVPPADLVNAFVATNSIKVFAPWEAFVDAYEGRFPETQDEFLTSYVSRDNPNDFTQNQYIEISHGDHSDLMCLPEGGCELFLRHPRKNGHDDEVMKDALLQPFLHRLRASGLAIERILMELTFVDEQGLHSVGLPDAMRLLGLL